MNCQLCQKEIEAAFGEKLSGVSQTQVEAHIAECETCAKSYQLMKLANKVMEAEKAEQSNPFLSTRIMAGIEKLDQCKEGFQHISAYQKVLKPVLISISLASALFIGVLAGNIYKPVQPEYKIPIEMSYMNDASLESVNLFANE